MGYDDGYDSDSNTSVFQRISSKELAIIVIITIIGGFFGVQAMFGFPINDIFRKEITEETKIILKDKQGTCVIEASDQRPRAIPNCPYNIGDTLIVTYKQGTASIEKYHIKR